MFWQEDETSGTFEVGDEVVDLLFGVRGRELPVDHAHALAAAILARAPWLEEHPNVAIQPIYLAGSQNGWERPDPGLGQKLQLSRRTRMAIRVPGKLSTRLQEALHGLEIDIEGCSIALGSAKARRLSSQTIIFTRGIVLEAGEEADENAFMRRVISGLDADGIAVKKAMSGRVQSFKTPQGPVLTRSLMLADLRLVDSIRLQQQGFGRLRHLGCGTFLPHKGIEAVGEAHEAH